MGSHGCPGDDASEVKDLRIARLIDALLSATAVQDLDLAGPLGRRA